MDNSKTIGTGAASAVRKRVEATPPAGRAALVYLGLLALAEGLTVLAAPPAGLALHGLVLMALLAQAGTAAARERRQLYLALSLAPLIRLLSLSIPLRGFPMAYWYLVIGAPLFLAAGLAARAGRLAIHSARLSPPRLLVQLLIGLSGAALGYIEYRILQPDPLVAGLRWELVWPPALVLLVFTGLLEEYIFRGLMQTAALASLGRAGLIYVAALFAALHLGYRSLADLLFVFAVALFFGWAAYRTRSILGVTLSHGLTNIGLFLVFPFLLAGAAPAAPADLPALPAEMLAPAVVEPRLPPTLAPVVTDAAPASPAVTAGGAWTRELAIATDRVYPATATGQPTGSPTAARTKPICRPPSGWVRYTVRPGDSLARLARAVRISAQELRAANCLEASGRIEPGLRIYLPRPLPAETEAEARDPEPEPAASQEPAKPPTKAPTKPPPAQPPDTPTQRPPKPEDTPTPAPGFPTSAPPEEPEVPTAPPLPEET